MNNNSTRIRELSNIFTPYKIFPYETYTQQTFVRHFQSTYPDDHFSKELHMFLECHEYIQERIGADLPWWGRRYFSEDNNVRTMVIAQDSNSLDAGSVTFYANLMPLMDELEYKKYIKPFQTFTGWKEAKNLLLEFGIDFDYLYITDARKVYPVESLKYKAFELDDKKIILENEMKRKALLRAKRNQFVNRELLLQEIHYCNPDLIVILGSSGLYLLNENCSLTSILEHGNTTNINGRDYYISPFPSQANPDYRKFKLSAVETIRVKISSLR